MVYRNKSFYLYTHVEKSARTKDERDRTDSIAESREKV